MDTLLSTGIMDIVYLHSSSLYLQGTIIKFLNGLKSNLIEHDVLGSILIILTSLILLSYINVNHSFEDQSINCVLHTSKIEGRRLLDKSVKIQKQ